MRFVQVSGLVLALSAACSAPAGPRAGAAAPQLALGPARERSAPLEPEREFVRQKFGGVRLSDQHGREHDVFEELVRGKLVLVNFVYTRCTGT